jgi:transposase
VAVEGVGRYKLGMSEIEQTLGAASARVRVKRPERQQVRWRDVALDQLVPRDHRVRAVWAYVESLDLEPLYAKIQAVEGRPGRDAVDPKILFALWMFATIEGVSSARHLERLAERDLAYLWICGDVGVNYHLLSDFRVLHGDFLDQLLTDTIATLLQQQLVTLETVAQDGMRVRANAGSGSFRREKTLLQFREEAAVQVNKLREERERDDDQDASNTRRRAAAERAADDRAARIEAAIQNLAELQQQKETRKKGSGAESRCSTTDPEARAMKMADGGFRPGYNVQFGSDGQTRMIVAVSLSNNGSDGGQMSPMQTDIRDRYGVTPQKYLTDGGFATIDDITLVEQAGSQVIAPLLHEERIRQRGGDPHARRPHDTDEMFAFRQRMTTDEAKAALRQRPSIAEFPNAVCRNQGLHQFPVRSLAKAHAIALWHALTFNFRRMLNLGILPQTT